MNQMQAERLSALVDGELTASEVELLVRQIARDPELRVEWARSHLISDVLHQELSPALGADLPGRIETALGGEPALARARMRMPIRPVAGFALAASVAVVAVLGLRQVTAPGPEGPRVASREAPVPARSLPGGGWNVERPEVARVLNEYLVNHSEYAGNGMQGMLPYARIVSYDASR